MKKVLLASLLAALALMQVMHAKARSTPTLKQQIGQMLILGFNGTQLDNNNPIVDDIKHQRISGVILFDYNYQTKTFDKNIASPTQVKALTTQLNTYQRQVSSTPLLISIDYEGGLVNRLKEDKGFPKTLSAKKIAELPLPIAEEKASRMANTLHSLGINFDFAPVVDVDVNPDNPVIGKLERSFSSSPDIVANYAYLFSRQFKDKKVLCAYKHFPGHGSSTADSHLGFVDVTDTWQAYELFPYQTLLPLNESCGFVMTAHIVNRHIDPSGLPATLSYKTLTGLLRNELHFKGVIISDDMQMKAISDNYGLHDAVVKAINAGADMLIFGNQLVDKPQSADELVNLIADAVKKGEIQKARIAGAYTRIIAAKKQAL